MTAEELQVAAFEIILYSGNSRTLVHEAFAAMRKGDYEEAAKLLENANEELLLAHKSQTKLLQEYAGGTEIKIEIIMVHAQDHLMTTMTLREVALEMLALYQKVA
ncbi:PTS cellobiose transporter subunit IIA [Streptococcus oriscaviae]|uniref:PTS cellobiose transporter subunit IIA n=1 Tax=Streptococcus oriscaviae TaxID=2781599 RepID=A0ABX7YPM9_9STRE|nr:PTS cellobiose transporter subunit IIA [Streptococcus oriscaviae]QUE55179.1 PTS cellobiose transporter subunit IIA [Streptococcus oriscaviae]